MIQFLKKVGGKPISFFKGHLKASTSADQQKEWKESAQGQIKKVKTHLSAVSQNRDPWDDNAPDMTDFNQVMDHWGIQRRHLDIIIRNLCIQTFVYCLAGIYGFWWVCTAKFLSIAGIPIMFLGVLALVCKSWKIQVLYKEEFVFFKDWFLWGTFAWVGKPTPIAIQKRKERKRAC